MNALYNYNNYCWPFVNKICLKQQGSAYGVLLYEILNDKNVIISVYV